MRIDVALTADTLVPAAVEGVTVLVIDVLRASTTIVTALANGCRAIVPVADADEAGRRAGGDGTMLRAGERRGENIPGFDLGNSPLEVTADRVRDKTLVLTTSNGTRALLAARRAAGVAVAGLVNLGAAAAWALGQGRDVTIACAGDRGEVSLEDHVCAGLLVERLTAACPTARLSERARAATVLGRRYASDLDRLRDDSPWARRLLHAGRDGDVAACLALDRFTLVPVYAANVDEIVPGCR